MIIFLTYHVCKSLSVQSMCIYSKKISLKVINTHLELRIVCSLDIKLHVNNYEIIIKSIDLRTLSLIRVSNILNELMRY